MILAFNRLLQNSVVTVMSVEVNIGRGRVVRWHGKFNELINWLINLVSM